MPRSGYGDNCRVKRHYSIDHPIICTYNKCVKVIYDPAKEQANIAKHGVSLALAKALDWGSALIWPDERADYGEARQAALVL